MFIIDAHCDSIEVASERKYGIVNPYNYSQKYNQLQMVALFCCWPKEDPKQCYDRAVRYIGQFMMCMENEQDKVMQVKTYADIEKAFSLGKHGAMLTIEGGSGIMGSPDILKEFYDIGVRIFGMTWLSNDLAKSNRVHDDGEEDTGLTDVGRAVVEKGNELGMIFDVSHISDNSFRQLAEIAKKPIIATHSNFRALCPHSRNLTDEMAKEIAKRDGMISLNLCRPFVHTEKDQQSVDMLLRHLEHGIELVGEDRIGFGFDIDGIDHLPTPLTLDRSIHDQFIEIMIRRGYSDALIRKISGENFLNFLKKYL